MSWIFLKMPKRLILPHFMQYANELMYVNKDMAC